MDEVHRHVWFRSIKPQQFPVSRKEADVESDATEVPSSAWIEIREKPADALGVARIQVDRKVAVTAIWLCGDFDIRIWPLPLSRVSFSDSVRI